MSFFENFCIHSKGLTGKETLVKLFWEGNLININSYFLLLFWSVFSRLKIKAQSALFPCYSIFVLFWNESKRAFPTDTSKPTFNRYGMVSSPPMKMGDLFLRASGWSAFSYAQWGDSFIWGESQLGISLVDVSTNFLPNWQMQDPSL